LSFQDYIFSWSTFHWWFWSLFFIRFLSLDLFDLLDFFSLILEFVSSFSFSIRHYIILLNNFVFILHTLRLLLLLLSSFRFINHDIFKCILFLLYLRFLKLWSSLLLVFVIFTLIISSINIVLRLLFFIFLIQSLYSICSARSLLSNMGLKLCFIIWILGWTW